MKYLCYFKFQNNLWTLDYLTMFKFITLLGCLLSHRLTIFIYENKIT